MIIPSSSQRPLPKLDGFSAPDFELLTQKDDDQSSFDIAQNNQILGGAVPDDRVLYSLNNIKPPLDVIKPGAGDGTTATPLAGTDPNVGGPDGGEDKGGSGYGVKETQTP